MSLIHVLDYINKLNNLLVSSGKTAAVMKEFYLIDENSERVRFLLKLFKEFDVIVEGKLKSEKSNAISDTCRTNGNQFCGKKQFVDALSSYNESLCFAESGSKNIALAYANRSAVYCEMELYEKCLKNIELAKKNQYPYIENLNKREETCLLMISNKNNNKVSPSNVPVGENYLNLSYPANKKLPFVADCLELKTDKEFGRHIITKTALQPGDIVCCEEPFMKFLNSSHRFKYCATCLNDNFLDLFPCSECTSTMFCSEECETIGQVKFHKFECPISDKLDVMCTKTLRLALRTFFEALYICDGNLKKLKALIDENQDSSMTVFDYEIPVEAKTVLKAIDALSTNESKRNEADMFHRAGVAAIVCDLFLNHTKLREVLVTRDDEDFFYSFVLKQNQIADCNYHGLYNGVESKSEVESSPQYGSGSFPFCSLLNHSCAPNVFRETADCKNFVVVIRPIPIGGQLFDSYGTHHCIETLQQRQISIQDQYKFKCTCEACKGNYPLHAQLEFKDLSFTDNAHKLETLSFDHAAEVFQQCRDYLTRMDSKHPCHEIYSVQVLFIRCFTIFAMSEFKLKLCED